MVRWTTTTTIVAAVVVATTTRWRVAHSKTRRVFVVRSGDDVALWRVAAQPYGMPPPLLHTLFV